MFENKKIEKAYLKIGKDRGLQPLDEVSLSHALGKQNTGYCIVSACRHDWVDRELEKLGGDFDKLQKNDQYRIKDGRYWNNLKTEELRKDLKNLGIGYVPVYGGFKESGVDVFEKSFMLFPMDNNRKEFPFDKLMNAAIELGAKYNQDSVLICPPGEAPYYCVTTDHMEGDELVKKGTEQRWFGKDTKLNDVAQQYFTSLNKIKEYPDDAGKATVKRFTFSESKICESVMMNSEALSYQQGHGRWAKGELSAVKR